MSSRSPARRPGIGRATALRLARDGAAIVALRAARRSAASRSPPRSPQPAARRCRRRRRHARSGHGPLRRRGGRRFGRLDVMICNAGFGIYGTIDDIAAEQMQQADRRQLHRHLSTRRARRCRVFRRQSRGHLIVVSSIVGKRGVPYMGAYCRDEIRAGRPCRVPARRGRTARTSTSASCFPISTETEFFDVMTQRIRRDVTRAMGPRQTRAGRRRDRARDRASGARGLPVQESARRSSC